ncbi:Pentatricopeptide repeat-containing protein -mitochondrial [Striga hermonthica]|uniref:Pentatricopeptide repeat-containing protein -mitochondrial n=1 Tax=Striga hermonthica TaxID=68872 RepID=A0A9N7NAB5_STRHE|nr:Pentatricopeptide repeat-containing protein -mitochondrial [Striga hermonthica]
MIIRQLNLQHLPKKFLLRSKHPNSISCSFYHGHHLLDEIPEPPSITRLMLNLIHQNRQAEAISLFKRHLTEVDESDIALAAKACIGRPKLGPQVHGFAVVSGFTAYVSVCNSLMNMYCKSDDFGTALRIFEHAKNPDTVSYNTVLSGFENHINALVFACEMHSAEVPVDAVTCTTVLAHCTNGLEFDFGFQLHCLTLKSGLKTETFVGNALVTLYSKFSMIADARLAFDEIPQKDLISWNAILSGYVQEGGQRLEALSGFLELVRRGLWPDHTSFTSVISACGHVRDLEFGKQAHAFLVKRGYGVHVSVCNVLMSMYSKCGNREDARLVYKNIANPNVVSFTTMLSIDEEDAVNLFREMTRRQVHPNDVTFVGLVHAVTEHNMIRQGISVHGFCIKSNFLSETHVANSFITMYGKFKLMDDCIKVFEEIGWLCRDIVTWNAFISAYTHNGMYQEALHAFWLASNELLPNAYTFGSVLSAISSSESVSIRQGQRCHSYIHKLGLDRDPVLSGALLDMYAKRGSIQESCKIFDELAQKSQVAWTAILSAHSRHGDHASVMECFEKMVSEGVRPDSITFLAVLTSCARSGTVDSGIAIFRSMVTEHSVEPCAEHYSCVVDMLGRAGRLEEAEEFVGRIPGVPGVSVLQSLLGACRVYGNVEMGIRISEALMGMEAGGSGSYVLMSNLFAEQGKWERAAKVRRMMREREVSKEVGFSWADVGGSGCLHGFSSGDKSHPLSHEIYEMAELLGLEMKRRRETIEDMIV